MEDLQMKILRPQSLAWLCEMGKNDIKHYKVVVWKKKENTAGIFYTVYLS